MTTADYIRDIDAFLRAVAPRECPPWSSSLVIEYRELAIDDTVDGGESRGLSSHGIDRFAAWLRGDDSLVGRPVFAVSVDRATAAARHETDPVAATLEGLRQTACHELAHAVFDRQADAGDTADPETFPERLRARLRDARPQFRSTATHGAAWWRVFVTLLARGQAIAPRLLPVSNVDPWADMYRYSAAGPARRWVAAARTDPDFLDLPLVDIPGRRVPALDELFAMIPTPAATIAAVAATTGDRHADDA